MYEILVPELRDDPLNRGYAAMTDQQRYDSLFGTIDRPQNVTSLSGNQIFQQTNGTEFVNLTEHKQLLWVSFCSAGDIDPWDANNVAFVEWIFGASSQTVQNLAAIRTTLVSRAVELGLTQVQLGNLVSAREMIGA